MRPASMIYIGRVGDGLADHAVVAGAEVLGGDDAAAAADAVEDGKEKEAASTGKKRICCCGRTWTLFAVRRT